MTDYALHEDDRTGCSQHLRYDERASGDLRDAVNQDDHDGVIKQIATKKIAKKAAKAKPAPKKAAKKATKKPAMAARAAKPAKQVASKPGKSGPYKFYSKKAKPAPTSAKPTHRRSKP